MDLKIDYTCLCGSCNEKVWELLNYNFKTSKNNLRDNQQSNMYVMLHAFQLFYVYLALIIKDV